MNWYSSMRKMLSSFMNGWQFESELLSVLEDKGDNTYYIGSLDYLGTKQMLSLQLC